MTWRRPPAPAPSGWGLPASLAAHGLALAVLGWVLVPHRAPEPEAASGMEVVWAEAPVGEAGDGAPEPPLTAPPAIVPPPGPPPLAQVPPPLPSTAPVAPPPPSPLAMAALPPPLPAPPPPVAETPVAAAAPPPPPPAEAPADLATPTPPPPTTLSEVPPPQAEPEPAPRPAAQAPAPRPAPRAPAPRQAAPRRDAATPSPTLAANGPATGAPAATLAAPAGPSAPPRPDAGFRNAGPAYPELARQRGQQGAVVLDLRVDAEGRVVGAEVAQSSGHPILDAAARRAVLNWRFRPALEAGRPVEAHLRSTVRFRLD